MGFRRIELGVQEIFTVIVQDQTGRQIDKWTVLKDDFPDVVKILLNKYGLSLKKKDKDLGWALN